jgi:HSP20 family protein
MITVVVRENRSGNKSPLSTTSFIDHYNQTSHIWVPPTDIFETESDFVIRIEVAGMIESDFNLLLEADKLYIEGKRSDESKRRAYQQMEIRFGEFHLCVDLPILFNRENIGAVYSDGFLVITLPKATPRSVKVEEG